MCDGKISDAQLREVALSRAATIPAKNDIEADMVVKVAELHYNFLKGDAPEKDLDPAAPSLD